MEEKIMDRQTVIDLVNKAIEERMSRDSIQIYVQAARQYGEQYGISGLVEDWIKEGRDEMSPEKASEWANSLP
jgi:hypothetical protein